METQVTPQFLNAEQNQTQELIMVAVPEVNDADATLASQWQQAAGTVAELRSQLRLLVGQYKKWRKHVRCGRSADGKQAVNEFLGRRIRTAWNTYKLAMMVMSDLALMLDVANGAASLPVPASANDDAPFSLEQLADRYGAELAHKLYHEMHRASVVRH